MSEVHMIAVLYAKAGREDALRADLVAVTGKSAAEEGNLRYQLFGDVNDERRFVIVEQWRDEASQQRHHFQSAHIAHFHAHGEVDVERRESVHVLRRIA